MRVLPLTGGERKRGKKRVSLRNTMQHDLQSPNWEKCDLCKKNKRNTN